MCKEAVKNFSEIWQLSDGWTPSSENSDSVVEKRDIVTTIAYLIGVREQLFSNYFSEDKELVASLRANKAATCVRDLCILRMQMIDNYAKTDKEIKFSLANLTRLSWFDQDAIRRLKENRISVEMPNYRAQDYMPYFNKLIKESIPACASLFPEWIRFDYISELFYFSKYETPSQQRAVFDRFVENRTKYPYGNIINWDFSMDSRAGNILLFDRKFVKLLYGQHGELFSDDSKFHDAKNETKTSIYNFIDSSERAVIVVDCENSDVFKLYGVLKNLNSDEVEKIEKIILYDDFHTTNAWTWLKKFISIPIEYVEVDRVTARKSLVDIRMTAGICKAYYEMHIDSFILCSSDSDFWGLISAIPTAKFLVMYEDNKCGQAIKAALDTRSIFYCSMDDFYTGNATDLKTAVLVHELRQKLNTVIGKTCAQITKEIFESTRIPGTEAEMKRFTDKYVRSIRLKIDDNGSFCAVITADC